MTELISAGSIPDNKKMTSVNEEYNPKFTA